MKILQKENARKEFLSCLNQDRKNGVKSAKYFYHYGAKRLMAIDNLTQFQLAMETYKSQGIELDRTEPISEEHKKMFGIEEGRMMFFHQKENKNISGNHCPLAFCFDYFIGTSEWFMIDVEKLSPRVVKTDSKIIPFTHIEREINPNPHGLKEWIFSGVKVYALNEKNAMRKAKKLGYVA